MHICVHIKYSCAIYCPMYPVLYAGFGACVRVRGALKSAVTVYKRRLNITGKLGGENLDRWPIFKWQHQLNCHWNVLVCVCVSVCSSERHVIGSRCGGTWTRLWLFVYVLFYATTLVHTRSPCKMYYERMSALRNVSFLLFLTSAFVPRCKFWYDWLIFGVRLRAAYGLYTEKKNRSWRSYHEQIQIHQVGTHIFDFM